MHDNFPGYSGVDDAMIDEMFPSLRRQEAAAGDDIVMNKGGRRSGRSGGRAVQLTPSFEPLPDWNPLTLYETPTAAIPQSWMGNPMLRQGRSRDTMEHFFGPQTVAG